MSVLKVQAFQFCSFLQKFVEFHQTLFHMLFKTCWILYDTNLAGRWKIQEKSNSDIKYYAFFSGDFRQMHIVLCSPTCIECAILKMCAILVTGWISHLMKGLLSSHLNLTILLPYAKSQCYLLLLQNNSFSIYRTDMVIAELCSKWLR